MCILAMCPELVSLRPALGVEDSIKNRRFDGSPAPGRMPPRGLATLDRLGAADPLSRLGARVIQPVAFRRCWIDSALSGRVVLEHQLQQPAKDGRASLGRTIDWPTSAGRRSASRCATLERGCDECCTVVLPSSWVC